MVLTDTTLHAVDQRSHSLWKCTSIELETQLDAAMPWYTQSPTSDITPAQIADTDSSHGALASTSDLAIDSQIKSTGVPSPNCGKCPHGAGQLHRSMYPSKP